MAYCCCCYVASVVSDSVRPQRRQPTRLPHPWDSPGKNTEVGCHYLLQYMKVKSESEITQSCPTTNDPVDCSLPGSSVHGICQTRVLEWGAIAFSIWHTNKLQLRMYPRVKLLIKNRFMSRFSSYCQTVSQSYLNSNSHQQYTRVPVAPQTCQQLVLSVLIILIIPVDLQ